MQLRPARLDRHVVAFHEANFTQTLSERDEERLIRLGQLTAQNSDHGHRWLLSARRHRPRSRRASEKGDKCTPLHSIPSSARPSSEGGRSSPSALPALRLTTSSNLTGNCTGSSPGLRRSQRLAARNAIQFSHLYANALKFRACGARCEICVACGDVGEGALPSDIRLAAVAARMFDEYFTGWKPDREAHGGSLAS